MEQTLIYLQTICDQLGEALGLDPSFGVAALIDGDADPHMVQGWCIVRHQPDGSMQPVEGKTYKTIFELMFFERRRMTSREVASAVVMPGSHVPQLSLAAAERNDLTQFEIRSISHRDLNEEYRWCLENISLKADRGLIFQVDEIYIITRSQRIIDKVNRRFGSDFNFSGRRVFYIE